MGISGRDHLNLMHVCMMDPVQTFNEALPDDDAMLP